MNSRGAQLLLRQGAVYLLSRIRSILAGPAAGLLDRRASSFLLNPPLLGSPCRPSRFARPRRRCRQPEQIAKLRETLVDIAALVARALAAQDQITLGTDAPVLLTAKSAFHIVRDAWTGGNVPAKYGPRGHLVDILASRSARAHEGPSKLVVGDPDCFIDHKHASSCHHCSLGCLDGNR